VIEIVEFDPMHEDIEDHTDPDWFECPILPRADMLAVIERRRQLDGRSLNLFRNALERKPRSDLLEHYIVPNLYRPGEHYIYTTPDANQYRFRNWRPELTAAAVECQTLAACALFSNPLAWIDETDLRPSERTYNAGFTVYTIESDQIPLDDQLQIIWSGKLKRIDADLRRYRDYRGYEVVYSGGKSLHFWTRDLPDLLLRPAYAANWDRLAPSATMFCDIAELDPNEFQPDRALAQWEQLRRCPWALRAIHGAHPLGLPSGYRVRQPVIAAGVFQHARRDAVDWFHVPEKLEQLCRSEEKRRPPRTLFQEDFIVTTRELVLFETQAPEKFRQLIGTEYPKFARFDVTRPACGASSKMVPTMPSPLRSVRETGTGSL
jgi:hypothetical protein